MRLGSCSQVANLAADRRGGPVSHYSGASERAAGSRDELNVRPGDRLSIRNCRHNSNSSAEAPVAIVIGFTMSATASWLAGRVGTASSGVLRSWGDPTLDMASFV